MSSSFYSPNIANLQPYIPGEQPKIDNLIKLNTNESPFPPAPEVVIAIQNELGVDGANLRLYPDPEASILKQAIAEFNGITPDKVFLGNGSDEVLAHSFTAFFCQGQQRPLLVPDISYSFYPVYAQLYGVTTKVIPLTAQMTIDVADYTGINGGVLIANPNAPTSVALNLNQIEQLVQQNTQSVVLIDEAYVDFGAQSAIQLIDKYPNLLVCQTTSKSRALAGMRIGMAFGQPHLIAALEKVKNSFNSYPLDRLAIVAGVASFKNKEYFLKTCNEIQQLRNSVVEQLNALGFTTLPSHANFIFTSHKMYAANDLQQQLRQQGIVVRHFNKPSIDNYLRITIGNAAQNTALIDTLKRIIQ